MSSFTAPNDRCANDPDFPDAKHSAKNVSWRAKMFEHFHAKARSHGYASLDEVFAALGEAPESRPEPIGFIHPDDLGMLRRYNDVGVLVTSQQVVPRLVPVYYFPKPLGKSA